MASGGESDVYDEVEKDTQTEVHHRAESDKLKLGESASGSRRSSVSSALLKTAAKRAALTAELIFLEKQQELEEEEFRLRQKREKLRLQMERSKIDAEESILTEAENGLMSASNSQLGGAAAAKPKIDLSQGGTVTAEVDTRHPLGGVSSRHNIADAVIPPLGGATVVSTRNQTSSDILVPATRQPSSDVGTTTYLRHFPPPGGATQVLSCLHPPLISDTVMHMNMRPPPGGVTVKLPHQEMPSGGVSGQLLQGSTIGNDTTFPAAHVYHAPAGVIASSSSQLPVTAVTASLPGATPVFSPFIGGATVPLSMNGASVSGATPVFSPFTGGATVPSSMRGTSTVTTSFIGGAAVPLSVPGIATAGFSYPGLPPSQNTGSRYQLNPNAPAWTGIHHDNSDGGLLNIIHQGQQQQRQLLNAIQIPKVEISVFDGDPMKYWTFIRTFENSVEKDTVDSCAKLARLLQYTTGKALKVIQSCAIMNPDDGYRRAKELLRERFGNPYTITETWIGHVTNGQTIKPNERQRLMDFADELRSCTDTLRAMGNTAEINAQSSLVKIIGRLPMFLQNKWKQEVRHIRKNQGRNPSIEDVTDFVLESAEVANDPVYGAITDSGKIEGKKHFVFAHQSYSDSQGSSVASSDTHAFYACLKCGGNHTLFGCDSFKALKVDDRMKFAFEKRLCFNCLKPGHISSRCFLERTCPVDGCGRKHTKFLHPLVPPGNIAPPVISSTNPQEAVKRPVATSPSQPGEESRSGYVKLEREENIDVNGARDHGSMRIAMPIVPVVVRAPGTQRSVQTYALLDSGSNSTFCSDELVKQLEIVGQKEPLNLTTMVKENSKVETEKVSLEVSDVKEENVLELPVVYSRPSLPVNLDNLCEPEDLSKWSHLQDIDLPQIEANKVTLLIGQDNSEALAPTELRKGVLGAPYATKTVLGWTLNGPLGDVHQHVATSDFKHDDIQHDMRHQVQVRSDPVIRPVLQLNPLWSYVLILLNLIINIVMLFKWNAEGTNGINYVNDTDSLPPSFRELNPGPASTSYPIVVYSLEGLYMLLLLVVVLELFIFNRPIVPTVTLFKNYLGTSNKNKDNGKKDTVFVTDENAPHSEAHCQGGGHFAWERLFSKHSASQDKELSCVSKKKCREIRV